MEKALKFLKACGVFYLATIEADPAGGAPSPRVRPFGAVCAFEGRLYIVTNNQKKVYAELMKNARLEISGMADNRWIRLSAQAVPDPRREARAAMLDANPTLRSLYSEDDGVMEVLYLKDAEASICSFTALPESWTF